MTRYHATSEGLIPYTEQEEIEANHLDEIQKVERLKQFKDFLIRQTQELLDDFARTRNYDNILSLCSYNDSTVPKFQAEAMYGIKARDITWAKLYELLEKNNIDSTLESLSFADIVKDLPELVWPDQI